MIAGVLLTAPLLSVRVWQWLLDTNLFMPHGHCYLWRPGLIFLHVISDAVIGLSYASIPITLIYFVVKRPDLPFHWIFLAFGTFIIACGATHVMEIVTLWTPVYWLAGAVKIICALASVLTAIALVRLLPYAIALPSTAVLERQTAELLCANSQLQHEVHEREQVQKEREELLVRERRARSDAEVANRLKDEFIATVSHELRTPLQAILGWTSLLGRDALAPQDVTRALRIIDRNAQAQAKLLNDILDVSRIVTGKLDLKLLPADLSHVIHAAIDSLRPLIESKGVTIELDLDPAAGPVLGDPSRLEQMIWNLLSNAIKFTPHGGQVSIRLRRQENQLLLGVSDTGEGIDPEFLPHVFERFRQYDSSTTRTKGGLGLGLSIVRHLAELHGGVVSVASAGKGQGSTFTLCLPRAMEDKPAAAEGQRTARDDVPQVIPSADMQPSISGLRVLVVDDEPDTRELLRTVLTARGAHVRAASSVAEALAMIEKECPDVLLSDLGMPVEDGYSLIRRLRARPAERGGNLPAAALSAYARAEDREAARQAGFQTHLPKPLDPMEVVAVVGSLSGRQLRPPASVP